MGFARHTFHTFNVYFRENKDCVVVAFTATQISDIEGRAFPNELAGNLQHKSILMNAKTDLLLSSRPST
jgi:predicted GTPase